MTNDISRRKCDLNWVVYRSFCCRWCENMSGESEDESKGRLTVCYILVDVIILGLFGWSKIVA